MTEEPERAAAGRASSSGEKDKRECDPNFPDGTLGPAASDKFAAVSNPRGVERANSLKASEAQRHSVRNDAAPGIDLQRDGVG
jgi:hypothetical protein